MEVQKQRSDHVRAEPIADYLFLDESTVMVQYAMQFFVFAALIF
jgi:hypothetical protein